MWRRLVMAPSRANSSSPPEWDPATPRAFTRPWTSSPSVFPAPAAAAKDRVDARSVEPGHVLHVAGCRGACAAGNLVAHGQSEQQCPAVDAVPLRQREDGGEGRAAGVAGGLGVGVVGLEAGDGRAVDQGRVGGGGAPAPARRGSRGRRRRCPGPGRRPCPPTASASPRSRWPGYPARRPSWPRPPAAAGHRRLSGLQTPPTGASRSWLLQAPPCVRFTLGIVLRASAARGCFERLEIRAMVF